MREKFNLTIQEQVPNSIEIRKYEFIRHGYNNPEKCYMNIEYVLGHTDDEGLFTPSNNMNHSRRLTLRNCGEDKQMLKFLKESGLGEEDLYSFDYHDILKICKEDAEDFYGVK